MELLLYPYFIPLLYFEIMNIFFVSHHVGRVWTHCLESSSIVQTSSRHFVSRILQKLNQGYTVKFLKRQFPSYRFKETDEDEALVDFKDVVLVLPPH